MRHQSRPKLNGNPGSRSGVLMLFAGLAVILMSAAVPAAAQDGAAKIKELRELEETKDLAPELFSIETSAEELEIRATPLTRDELAALATRWLLIVQAKSLEVAEAQIAVLRSEGEARDAARETHRRLVDERSGMFDRYTAVLDAWQKKGADAAAIKAFRDYRSAIVLEEALALDFQTLLDRAVRWLVEPSGALRLVTRIAVALAWIYGILLVARIARRMVERRVRLIPNTSKLLQLSVSRISYWIVLFVGMVLVLSVLGFDLAVIFALFGGASFIIGFAMQDTLANLASGLMILVNRPFDEGDTVEIGGVTGRVKSVSIVATTVTTLDNRDVVIPNKQVWGNIISNASANDTRRLLLDFAIDYDDDVTAAIAVIRETVTSHPSVLEFPETAIMVGELAESSVRILCRPWTKTEDYFAVKWDLTRQIKENLAGAGFSVPYTRREIKVTQAGEPT